METNCRRGRAAEWRLAVGLGVEEGRGRSAPRGQIVGQPATLVLVHDGGEVRLGGSAVDEDRHPPIASGDAGQDDWRAVQAILSATDVLLAASGGTEISLTR